MEKRVKEHLKFDKNAKKIHAKKTKRIRLVSAGFILPSFIGVALFFFLPYLVVLRYSFVDNPLSMRFVGFNNFKYVLSNAAFRLACKNTAIFSAFAVPLAVLLSLCLALILDNKLPFRSQFRTCFLTPLMVPVASIVLIWQVLFHYNGAVNDFLLKFGIAKTDWFKSKSAIVVIVVLFLWKNLGYNMIMFMAALSAIPKDILEVARLESANRVQIFFMIKIRYLSSTILFVTIMSLINSFKIFREIYQLTTDYPYDAIYMLQHFMNNKFKNLDYQVLSASAVVMSVVMVVIIALLFLVDNRVGKDVEG